MKAERISLLLGLWFLFCATCHIQAYGALVKVNPQTVLTPWRQNHYDFANA